MLNYVEDALGEVVSAGEMVIASRPSGSGGSSYLELCIVHKVNDKSVSLQPVNRDGSPALDWWPKDNPAPKAKFSVTKNHGNDKCVKIARYKP